MLRNAKARTLVVMPYQTVIEQIGDGVAVLTMNRPRQRNAFNTTMYDEMAAALASAREDDRVRAVVVTGCEGAFSAGQDLAEMGALAGGERHGDSHGFPRFMDALCAFDKPLLAAVNGVGVGLGFTMLLHCDIVYVASDARLRLPFVPLGVVPEAASSYLLPLVVGTQAAADIVFTGRWVDAQEAVSLGLASRVVDADALLPTVHAKAREIAAGPLGALRHSKQLMRAPRLEQIRSARAREDAAFRERVGSPENLEALQAFLEKRPSRFDGPA